MKKKKLFIIGSLSLGIIMFSNDLNVEATPNYSILGNEKITEIQRNNNVSTVLEIYPSERTEDYSELLDTFFWRSSSQSTGIYKRKGDTIEIYVDESAQQLPTYTLTGISLSDYREGGKSGTHLQRGKNTISGDQEGIIHIRNEGPRVTQQTTRVEIRGGVTIPRFVLGKMTDKEWQDELNKYPNAPGYELVGPNTLITGSDKTIALVKEPTKILESKEHLITLHDKTSGIDGSSSLHRKPIGLIQHFRETSSQSSYMYAADRHLGFDHQEAMKVLLDPTYQDRWGVWHELGHKYQVEGMDWKELDEVTVNIFSMRAQKALGQRSRLEKDNVYTRIFNYLNNNQSNNFDRQGDFVKLGMFWQLELAFGEDFYPNLHKLYREEGKHLATEQEKRQYFILSASKISQTNLAPFFEKWGIEVTADTSKQLAQLPNLTKKIWEYRDEMNGDVGNIPQDDENNNENNDENNNENNDENNNENNDENNGESAIEEWSSVKDYVAGDIVMYQGHRYRAKWWNRNKVPATSNDWELLDNVIIEPTIEEWSSSKVYNGGEIVTYQGDKYRARWWNYNKIPGITQDWELLK